MRGGVINAYQNPAELGELKMKVDVNLLSTSFTVSGNRVGFNDLFGNDYFDQVLLAGSQPVNMKINGVIIGPAVVFRIKDWGFGISSKVNVQANIINADPVLARAVTSTEIDNIMITPVNFSQNQRLSATTWGEISLGAGHKIFETETHRINAGISLNLLFPGSYANIGISALNGTISNNAGNLRLNDASGNLNFAYSGPLSRTFESGSFAKNLFADLDGFSADIGFDYQYKQNGAYFVKAGLALKNLGSMKFSSDNNYETNYTLSVSDPNPNGGLDLNQFDGVESVEEAEDILLASGYLDQNEPTRSNFRVRLPALMNLYADLRIIERFHTTVFLQHKLQQDSDNDQVVSQNNFTLTPRYVTGFFEAYLPVSFSEYSNTAIG
ncbi:MAG: hypothetical protein EOO01_26945, partial [Chitinophagaceae bacterium]